MIGRILGFLVGVGMAVLGFFFWMLSNDGLGSEAWMKVIGGALMLVGILAVWASITPSAPASKDGSSGPAREDP